MEARKFQPTLRVTKPAGRNSERPIANQVLENKDRLRAVRSPSLSPPLSKDEELEDSVTVRGSSNYGMRDALPPGQDKQIQFETQDDGIYDRPQSQRHQQKTPPPPQSALAIVASGGVERQKQGGQRINNIGMSNMVILKRPAVKEASNDFEHHHK